VLPRFEYGEAVRVIRNLRNDGTYPGQDTGKLLVRRGNVGYVRDVGTYLQDQLIYKVDFFELGIMVGCREQELILESDPYVHTRYEFRDKITPKIPLGIKGEVIAKPGDEGEIEKVLKDEEGGPFYHARFSGRVLMVPESSIEFLDKELAEE
jgi:nitrogen fixation protein NifZ